MGKEWIPAIVGFIAGMATIFGALMNKQGLLASKKIESGSHLEKVYLENVPYIIDEYKSQVVGFREDLESVRKEFEQFKIDHDKEVLVFKKEMVKKEKKIVTLTDENERLFVEVEQLNELLEEVNEDVVVLDKYNQSLLLRNKELRDSELKEHIDDVLREGD